MAIFSVTGMDVCTLLDQHVGRFEFEPVPESWGRCEALAEVGSLRSLIGAIRRLDDRSDSTLLALLVGEARGDPLAASVIVAALLPLVLARCRGRRDRVDDYVGELALVIGTAEVDALRRSRRRVGSVLLDRAWDEVRGPFRRPAPVVPVDPMAMPWSDGVGLCSVEDDVLARVEVAEFESAVRRAAVDRPLVWPAWRSAVELVDCGHRDAVAARRWKYARDVLRRHVPPPVVAG